MKLDMHIEYDNVPTHLVARRARSAISDCLVVTVMLVSMSVCLCVCGCDMSVRRPISHHNFVKCGRLLQNLKWEYVKGQGRGHRNCEKHIIVDNSRTTHLRNVKLVPT